MIDFIEITGVRYKAIQLPTNSKTECLLSTWQENSSELKHS